MKVVRQLDATDCAAACLASISIEFGREITVTKLRDICGTDIKGTNLVGLTNGLTELNFDSKIVRIEEKDLNNKLQLPAIAQVITDDGLSHFVVISKIKKKKILLMDPSKGKVAIDKDKFLTQFTNIIVLAKPNTLFQPSKRQTKSVFSLFTELLKPQKHLFIVAIVSSIILTVLGIAASFFNKILIDEILPYNLKNQLVIFCIGFMMLGIIQIGIGAIRQHILLHLSQKIDIPLMLGYYKHIMSLPMSFFATRKVGDILTRFSDAGTIKSVYVNIALSLLLDIVMAVVSGVILFIMNRKLFAIVIVLALISVVLIYIFKRPYKKINITQMEQGAKLNSQMIESLRGVETIKANANEEAAQEKLEHRFIASLRTAYREGVLSNVQSSISGIIGAVGNLAMMWLGATLVMNGEITLGTLMAFSSLSGFFMDPIGRLVSLQLSLQEANIAMKRLSEIYEVEGEGWTSTGREDVDMKGDIIVNDVTFRYGERKPVLEKIRLSIQKGQKVAIVGESGSGKSTLVKLLLRMWSPEEGKITISDEDISNFDLKTLRKKIAYVQQNIELFSGTVKENIKVGNENASEVEIKKACELAGCSEFIATLPAGYESYIEEAGANLSGGERQRLALARAFVKAPDILVLDEATSNLDFLSEKLIYESIFDKVKDTTVIIVAHRLSTIKKCDKIYVLDKGKVAEVDSHLGLIRHGGVYAKLWASQVGVEADGTKTAPKKPIIKDDKFLQETTGKGFTPTVSGGEISYDDNANDRIVLNKGDK